MTQALVDAADTIIAAATALDGTALAVEGGAATDLERIRAAATRFITLLAQFVPPQADAAPILLTRTATHDLLNPLSQIIGYGEMLLEDATAGEDDAAERQLQSIVRSARDLATQVEIAGGRQVSTAESDAVAQVSGVEPTAASVSASHVPTRPAPRATNPLLVVDDDEVNRDLLTERLGRQGFAVLAAQDGVRALEILEQQAIDLVLLDVLMPQLDGYQVLERMQSNPRLQDIPVLMISGLSEIESVVRCIEMGAADYLTKPFNPVLLQARIGACLEKKLLRDQERRTFQALEESQRALAAELSEAADYVRSLLPPPARAGGVSVDWRFLPSMRLGGDAFGHHWIDADHLALYLFDVCGHGVGAALLSVAVIDALRSGRLRDVDRTDPAAVLGGLNQAFPMELHNGQYFTMWYGVYHRPSRMLAHSSGGHPPALLVSEVDGVLHTTPVWHPGMIVGGFPDVSYGAAATHIPTGATLYIFSDGLFEVTTPSGGMTSYEDFVAALSGAAGGTGALDEIVRTMRRWRGADTFEDDVSIMEVRFD